MATANHRRSISDASTSHLSRVSSLSTQQSTSTASPRSSTRRPPSQTPTLSPDSPTSTGRSAIGSPTQEQGHQPTQEPVANGQVPVRVDSSVGVKPHSTLEPKGLPRSNTSKAFSRWNDWWIWEILAGIMSILTLMAICIVLGIYDGKPQPNIQWGITLNAVIALLATIMRAAYITLLAEGTSQLKWLAFTREAKRPIHDFDVYDAASRGGFGSVRVLWRLRRTFYRDIVTLGALLYILSIGVDTFVQQLIQTRYQDADEGVADVLLARNERYDSYYQLADHQGSPTPDNLDSEMTAAVYSGLYGRSSDLPQSLFTCPSGNCTYPLTPSLAICSQCKDLKHELKQIDEVMNVWTLPKGPQIDELTLFNVSSTANASHTNAFEDAGTIIAAFSYINGTGYLNTVTGQDIVPDAHECVLLFCVEVYDASVTQGTLKQSVVHTFNRTNPHADTNGTFPDYMFDFQISTPSDSIPGPSRTSTFNISSKALLGLQLKVPPLFSGSVTTGTHGLASGGIFNSDIMQRLYTMTNATALVTNLASSMTTSVRRSTAVYASVPLSTTVPPSYSAPLYAGTAYRTIPHVHVVWAWIALPAVAVAFANVFLAVAMFMTHRTRKIVNVGVWKSSQVPLLYHGLDPQSEASVEFELGPSANIREMEEHAERFNVRLKKTDGGILKLGT